MSEERLEQEMSSQGAGGELPPELKAIEAELAELCPRDDRLNRERLVFLAGLASAAGWGGRAARWLWPASLAGMTAVAATLLAMLLVRPEPAVVERIRIVKTPVEARRTVARTDDPSPTSRPLVSKPAEPDESLSTADPRWPSYPGWALLRTRASDIERLDRMLAQDADLWSRPARAPVSGGPPVDDPLPYHEWLRSLFGDQPRAGRPGEWPNTPSRPGASS